MLNVNKESYVDCDENSRRSEGTLYEKSYKVLGERDQLNFILLYNCQDEL